MPPHISCYGKYSKGIQRARVWAKVPGVVYARPIEEEPIVRRAIVNDGRTVYKKPDPSKFITSDELAKRCGVSNCSARAAAVAADPDYVVFTDEGEYVSRRYYRLSKLTSYIKAHSVVDVSSLEGEWMSAEDATAYLGYSSKTSVTKLKCAGKLHPVRVFKDNKRLSNMYSKEELDQFIMTRNELEVSV